MAVAEDRSWEYTLGRIDERTEQHGKDTAELRTDVTGLRGDVNDIKDTAGRIDERTEQHGKDIGQLRADVARLQAGQNEAREAMLTKTTFFAVAAVITALLATMIAIK